jgi:hypothetical protein
LKQAENRARGLHPETHHFESFGQTWMGGFPPFVPRGGLDVIVYAFVKPQELASLGIEAGTGWSRQEQVDVFTVMTTANPTPEVIYDQERLRRDPSRGTARTIWHHSTDPWTYFLLGQAAYADHKLAKAIAQARDAQAADSLSHVLLRRYQAFYDEAYSQVLRRQAEGRLRIPARMAGDPQLERVYIGQLVDRTVRLDMRNWLAAQGIAEGPGGGVQVNRWLLDPMGSGRHCIPDLAIPGECTIIEGTLTEKTLSTRQIQDMLRFSEGHTIILVRPHHNPKVLYPRVR